ncbi:hypothetical protein Leryth_020788 [Lithospermum erythrorhizon]|nr:hypothetical protein Leryth_020788 [Lithospermum erythrorhizon]
MEGCGMAVLSNRTAHKSSALYSNPGLIHRSQYIKAYTKVIGAVGGSSNGKANSSFALEGGEPKVSRPGCFSGANDVCSGANSWFHSIPLWLSAVAVVVALACCF